MTRSHMMRIFFAIEPDDAMREACRTIVRILKKAVHTHDIRWVRPENYHITLCFIKSFAENDLERLKGRVKEMITTLPKIGLAHISGLVTFPNFYRPRVLALDIAPPDVFTPLANALTALASSFVQSTDLVPYHAHLTLGRIKHPASVRVDQIKDAKLPGTLPFTPKHITLFQSDPQPEGSQYIVLERFPL